DNGGHDAGEPYIDCNGNGKYDGPDGRAKDHMVWKAFRVIWSGEAAVSPAGQGTVHDSFLSRSGNTVTLTLFDRNFNALAADGPSSSDGVAWTAGCDSDGAIAFQVEDQAMEQIHPGVLFTSDGSIGVPAQRGTWTRNMDYFN